MLPYKNPLAYKQLRTWQQANEILRLTEEFIKTLPHNEPAKSHMDRSARSTVRNIEEGFRRTSTREYINFLGFSAGSNEELMADFEHCLSSGHFNPHWGEESQAMAERGFWLCKGEGKMLFNQIKALERKMITEKTLSASENARRAMKENKERQEEFNKYLKGFLRDKKGP
ncbi:MAG TPA: four helix bundle protein [Patescibacteria group bacterium]|nr:four helix bundle protein [Patescibacteria group bacterium]